MFYYLFQSSRWFPRILWLASVKNTVISSDFLVLKFCGKAQFSHSLQNYAETVPFRKISTPANQVKLRYFSQCSLYGIAIILVINQRWKHWDYALQHPFSLSRCVLPLHCIKNICHWRFFSKCEHIFIFHKNFIVIISVRKVWQFSFELRWFWKIFYELVYIFRCFGILTCMVSIYFILIFFLVVF